MLCLFIGAVSLVMPYLMKSMQFDEIMTWKPHFLVGQSMDSKLFCSFGM